MKTHLTSRFDVDLYYLLAIGLMSIPPTHAGTNIWNVPAPAANNWNVAANWDPASVPGPADTALFGEIGTSPDLYTVNNVVSGSTTIWSLFFTNTTADTWHVTQIPFGVILRVNNQVLVGGQSGVGFATSVAMTGGGAFVVSGSTNRFTLGNTVPGSSGNATPGNLDLSGLSTFVFDATNGIIGVGTTPTGSGGSRYTGSLTLASSNHVTTATINVLGATGTTSSPILTFGSETNIINVNTFNVGSGRATATNTIAGAGGLRLRGTGGDDTNRTTMLLGNRDTGGTGSSVNARGYVLWSGHPVDAKLATLTLGQMGRSQSGTDAGKYIATGVFEFDQGIVDATTINMGVCSGNSTNSMGIGLLSVGYNATLIFTNMSLANVTSTATNTGGRGTLSVVLGTVDCRGSIYKSTTLGSTGIVEVTNGKLSVSGSMGTATNAIDTLMLSDAVLTVRAASAPTIYAKTLNIAGYTNVINITTLPNVFAYPAQFPLIKYTTLSGDGPGSLGVGTLPPASPAFQGYFSNNVANGSIDLVITDGPPPSRSLVWNGTPTGVWDLAANTWLSSGSTTFYRQNDAVLFDDTAAGTTSVDLGTTLTPLSITVSNISKDYTFTGSGALSGTNALVKAGAGKLTIGNTGVNDFTGGITVNAGKLQMSGSADRLPMNGIVALADEATASLDLNNLDLAVGAVTGGGNVGGNVSLGTGTLSINGAGTYGGVISGSGQLVKSGPGAFTLANANAYTGGTLINTGSVVVVNTTGSGTGPGPVLIAGGTLMLGTNSPSGSIAPQMSGYITNHGELRFNRSDTLTPDEFITGDGSVRHSGSGILVFDHDNSYTNITTVDRNNGILRISSPNALGTTEGGTLVSGGNGSPLASGGYLEMTGNVVFAPEPLTLGNRGNNILQWVAGPQFVNGGGTNTWTGPIDITQGGSYAAVQSDAGLMRIAGSIAGGPIATSTRTFVFKGVAYGEVSGVISNGPVTTALNIIVGESATWTFLADNLYTGLTLVTNTATLLVNGTVRGSSVSIVGGKLGGTGNIYSPVTIGTAGTLSPGVSIGTLTITSNLTLNGTTEMEVSHSAADKVAGLSGVTLGGTLKVIVTGSLSGGEVFTLFEAPAGTYQGSFASYDLPTLPSPLAWDTSSLPVDGTLKVTGILAEPPKIGGISRMVDGNFQMSGTGPDGATYRVLATTSIALPWTNWVEVGSGTFVGGTFTFADQNATNFVNRFYSVVSP